MLSGANAGPVEQALLRTMPMPPAPRRCAFNRCFPHRFYLELQRAGRSEDAVLVEHTVQLAARLQLPVVATQPIQFLKPDSFRGPRSARHHCRAKVLMQASTPLYARAVLQKQRANARAVCRCALGQHRGDCAPLQREFGAGQIFCPTTPEGMTPENFSAEVAAWSGRATGTALPRNPRARCAAARATWSAWV